MKLINTQANHNKIKQTNLGKYRYFGQLIILFLCLTFIKTSFSIDVEDITEFGTSKSEPIDSGFYFHEGKYIDTPYVIERRGLNIYINDILLMPGPEWLIYDFKVETDPGDPPDGSYPFDKIPANTDSRDTYWEKKWRYLYSHFEYETAKKIMFETYKKSSDISNVYWSDKLTDTVCVVNKSGREKLISLSLLNNDYALNPPKKEDLIERMEDEKQFHENRFKNNVAVFKKKGTTLVLSGEGAANIIEILLSDSSDSEKLEILKDKVRGIGQGINSAQWIVTGFEDSPQLKERLKLLKKQNIAMPQIQNSLNFLNSTKIDPNDDLLTSNISTDLQQEDSQIIVSPNSVSIPIAKIENKKIENSSGNNRLYVIVSLAIAVSIIPMILFNLYKRKGVRSK